eukprot:snap_masked-scaffold_2-processed-gene-11.30-mRNA-1 protein AED:1.00 eAED:1.00 QI:0/0/0/0/1/1/2/0/72
MNTGRSVTEVTDRTLMLATRSLNLFGANLFNSALVLRYLYVAQRVFKYFDLGIGPYRMNLRLLLNTFIQFKK